MRKALMLGSVSVCALFLSSAATGQAPAPAQVPPMDGTPAEAAQDIVVTGSRITAAGFDAPTPTTTLSAETIQRVAQPNIFNALTQLPALQGSTGTTNNTQNGNTSVGDNGLSALNLRGLGTIRTLTLLDGQRVVPAYINGVVDISQFPQLLIKKVDVVTGGASASYGSDAVAGVVNFVTDKQFEGIKANLQGGITTYGDDRSILGQVAVGHGFLDNRLHLEASGEFFRNSGVPGGEVGGKLANGRPVSYREGSASYALGRQPTGTPQYYFYPRDLQDASFGRYGLITAGPLRGTAFDAAGNVTAFQFGSNCIGSLCQGGDQSNFVTSTRTVDDPMRRIVGYARAGFDVTPDIEIYGTASVSQVKISNTPTAYPRRAGITISCSNPYLPTSVATACRTNNITSFTFGTTNSTFPEKAVIYNTRTQKRFVGGADGKFSLFGSDVTFDAHYEHGKNRVNINIENMTLLPHYNAAIQATRNAAGQITCSTPAATALGCVPLNVFGGPTLTDAQYRFIAPENGPHSITNFTEDAGAVSFNLTPFRNWAGDVAVAVGGEWRREHYVTRADPYGAGISADSLNDDDYPVDPLLATAGSNWFAGNYKNGRGTYNVKEAFLELGVPIWNGDAAGKLDLNLAGRIADYSTAGVARTWKVGATWATPLDGLRLRGVVSRDIRAPNLSELFAAPQTTTLIVVNRATGGNVQVLANTVGNTNLKPEVSNNKEVGLVYRPDFLQNLVFSVDYFDIKVRQAISAFSAQQIIDLCFNGNQAFCGGFDLSGTIGTANAPFVTVQPFNLASLKTRGVDVELSYRIDLRQAGMLNLHALATRTIDYTSNPGIAGQIVQQLAGSNSTDTPKWKVNLSQSWTLGAFSLNLVERIVSAGKINPNYFTCTSSCPASTIQNPTTNFNHIPGAVYFDVGGSYRINDALEVYGRVDNATNHRIPPFGSTTIYDVIGRTFRLGVRFTT